MREKIKLGVPKRNGLCYSNWYQKRRRGIVAVEASYRKLLVDAKQLM